MKKILCAFISIIICNQAFATELFTDISEFNNTAVKEFIQSGGDLSVRGENGVSPVHHAVAQRNYTALWLLLQAGADAKGITTDEPDTDQMRKIPLYQSVKMRDYISANLLVAGGAFVEEVLFLLIEDSDTEGTRSLLEMGVPPENQADPNKASALFYAAANGQKDIVTLLLSYDADPNRLVQGVTTPLRAALHSNYSSVIELLLENGAETEIPDFEGFTPLMTAIDMEHYDTAVMLLNYGADPDASNENYSALALAAMSSNTKLVKALLLEGAEVNIGTGKYTPLIASIIEGDREIYELLLENGADPDYTIEENGITAVMAACYAGRKEMAEDLISRGADISNVDNDGTPVFFYAVMSGEVSLVKDLIEKGADVTSENKKQITALHAAVAENHTDIASMLLEYDFNVDQQETERGYTPLMQASVNNNVELIQALLDKGASVDTMSYNNETPIFHACYGEGTEAASLLLANGADVNITNDEGYNPVHIAIALKNAAMLQLLIEAGAELDRTYKDMDIITFAEEYADAQIVEILLEAGAEKKAADEPKADEPKANGPEASGQQH